jgi:tetratricopeptide (TPR) repeat protein
MIGYSVQMGDSRTLRVFNLALIVVVLLGGANLAGQVSTAAKKTSSHASGSPSTSTSKRVTRTFDEIAKQADEAWKAHRLEDAATLYRQAVDLRPAWAEGWGFLASSLYQLEKYPEARDAYRETTILTPANAPSWAYLGLCEYEVRDYRRSFDDLTKAEKMGLGDDRDLVAQVKYHLAILWNTAGQFERGLSEMLWFTQRNLGSPEILEAIGLSVLRVPLFPNEVPEDKQQMLMLAGEASFAANTQKMDEARKIYEQIAANYPKEPNVHFAVGQFLSHLDLEASLKEYEKEIELNPSHAYARIEAAFIYLKMGDLDKSLSQAQEAAKLQPQNPAAHNLIGRVLMEQNRTADAIPELVLATRYGPMNSGFHLNLARAYQKQGETTLAQKEIATFNELEKKRAEQQPAAPAPTAK